MRASGHAFAVVAVLVTAASAGATSIEDCQRVMAQFQGDVSQLAVSGGRAAKDRGDLRTQLRVAGKAGSHSDFTGVNKALDAFEQQAKALQKSGRVSRFDGDRIVRSAEAVRLCFERAEQGR